MCIYNIRSTIQEFKKLKRTNIKSSIHQKIHLKFDYLILHFYKVFSSKQMAIVILISTIKISNHVCIRFYQPVLGNNVRGTVAQVQLTQIGQLSQLTRPQNVRCNPTQATLSALPTSHTPTHFPSRFSPFSVLLLPWDRIPSFEFSSLRSNFIICCANCTRAVCVYVCVLSDFN